MPRPTSTALSEGGTGPEDLVLVQRALRGEPGAVEGLLQRLSCVLRFVFRLNRKLGCNLPTDALEDVVQQVYLAVWPRLRDFAGSAAIESWVFGFCRNCLRAEMRRRRSAGRATGLEPEELEAKATDHAPPPGEGIETAEGLDALRDELDRLTPDERRAVELRHLEGMSFEDIARLVQVPASTVKERCYRAMMRMKGRLRRDGHT